MNDATPLTPRVRFYLEHQAQIEEWNAIGYEARSATSEMLSNMLGDFDGMFEEEGLEPLSLQAGKYKSIFFVRPGTQLAEDGTPRLAVCFQWNPSWLVLTSDTHGPFVAVRVAKGQFEDWGEVRERFVARARTERSRLGLKGQGDNDWPAWRRVAAQAWWWNDFPTYQHEVTAAVREFISTFQTAIDDASSG